MKNKEKYTNEILKIAFYEEYPCCFVRKYIITEGECKKMDCSECAEKTNIWLEEEYTEQKTVTENKMETDWNKVPPDTFVKVSNNGEV